MLAKHVQHYAPAVFYSQHTYCCAADGVGLVAAYQNESIAAAVVLAAVVLPGPRRFLYRHTLGRLRSEEVGCQHAMDSGDRR